MNGVEDFYFGPTYVLWQSVVFSNVMPLYAVLQSIFYTEDGNSNFLRNFGNNFATT
jgi:hypothetical protein